MAVLVTRLAGACSPFFLLKNFLAAVLLGGLSLLILMITYSFWVIRHG